MQANSQLYEAVRQKVDLGQQLEQWQVCYQFFISRGETLFGLSDI
jgi:hypothetical protein